MNEQLEIKICGREFGISLKGYNAQASQEIRDMFEKKNVDLLDIVRAYLDVVHQKCELESSLQNIAMKLDNVAIKPSGEACEADSDLDSGAVKAGEAESMEEAGADSGLASSLDSSAESILETSADLETESKKVDSSMIISANQAESNSKKQSPQKPILQKPSAQKLSAQKQNAKKPKMLESDLSNQSALDSALPKADLIKADLAKTTLPKLDSAKSSQKDIKPASQSLNPIPQSLFETDFRLASNTLL